jgi:hypothetical protein
MSSWSPYARNGDRRPIMVRSISECYPEPIDAVNDGFEQEEDLDQVNDEEAEIPIIDQLFVPPSKTDE